MQLLEADAVTERRIRDFAQTLSEKDRRRFAAIEATQRGNGGIADIAGVLGCWDARLYWFSGTLNVDDWLPAINSIREKQPSVQTAFLRLATRQDSMSN